MLPSFITALTDFILPPRPTERMLRTVTAEQLQDLQTEEGLPYHDPRVQALVWELKYHSSRRARALAGAILAEELLAIAAEEIGVPLLVPVPMHPTRRRARGHNQTELLCKAALAHLGGALAYAPRALTRIKDTPTQQGLERSKRLRNVKDSMSADEKIVTGRVCVVVDDVTTTGATLEEAKRARRQGGARAVHCIALARS